MPSQPTLLELLNELDTCPLGEAGWRQFEDVCTRILTYAFVPPLVAPHIQVRTYSGIDRRDAVFPNRGFTTDTIWGQIHHDVGARMVLCEFKNYAKSRLTSTEVDQCRLYLTPTIGNLALMCCRAEPAKSAYKRRIEVYSLEKKVILFILPDRLKELAYLREKGADPAGLIMDMIELFYLNCY
ncbi:MAG: hypothetical protein ACM3WU_08455 [Bacillota bacterium]